MILKYNFTSKTKLFKNPEVNRKLSICCIKDKFNSKTISLFGNTINGLCQTIAGKLELFI